MTELEALVLKAVSDEGRVHGTAIGQAVELARGRVVGVGSIYKALYRLEANGLLTAEWEKSRDTIHRGPRRRYYKITGAGVRALRDWIQDTRRLARTLSLGKAHQ